MKKSSLLRCIAVLGLIYSGAAFAAVRNVKDYGAIGNGVASDTAAINSTVAACEPNDVVYFPAGTFKSGSIVLKSNITLELSAGATLLATSAAEYSPVTPNPWYRPIEYQDWGHSHWESSLIWGIGLENITITGTGLIDGAGLTAGDPAPLYGDRAISFKDCTGIRIENIKIYRAGHFGIITTGCSDVTIHNVLIDTNRDGINIDCCSDVVITNCVVNSPKDDAICMKSSYALGYKRATENVRIDNCTVTGYRVGDVIHDVVPRTTDPSNWKHGRIKFGTESNGGFKNITITNCYFEYSYGFMLATVDGGDIENITISDITMVNLHHPPIFLRLGNRARGPGSPPPGTYRNLTMSNITATMHSTAPKISCIATGIPGHRIENIVFNNVTVTSNGGGSSADAAVMLGENEQGYPDATMFGQITPSYAFYLRHVNDAAFHGCSFDFINNDVRPAFTLIDVNGIELDDVYAQRNSSGIGDHITFTGVDNVNIHNSPRFPPVTATYYSLIALPNKLNAGEPFAVSANFISDSSGVCSAVLTADSKYVDTAYAWLNASSLKTVTLPDVTLSELGPRVLAMGTQNAVVTICPRGDFDLSGKVDVQDLSVFAKDWLLETGQFILPNDPNGPVGWWKLDEGSGGVAYDSSGNNNTGYLYNMNNNNWVTGHDGWALDFDGAYGYLRVPNSSSVSVGASNYTLCAWVYPHTLSAKAGIITKTEGSMNKEYAFYIDSSGKLVLEVESNANDGISSTGDPVVQVGQWQHIMVTFNAATRTPTFYHNFQEVPGGSAFGALPTRLNNDLYIGIWGQGYLNNRFDGLIDDVRIYNYQLFPAPRSPGDFDKNNIVDLADLAVFAANWLTDIN